MASMMGVLELGFKLFLYNIARHQDTNSDGSHKLYGLRSPAVPFSFYLVESRMAGLWV